MRCMPIKNAHRIYLNRDETRLWHDDDPGFRADIGRAAAIAAYADDADCEIWDSNGYILLTVKPDGLGVLPHPNANR